MSNELISGLINGLANRDWKALAKAITIVENGYDGKELLLNYAYQTEKENCLIIGITGAGGAGKSTLIDSVLQLYSAKGKRIGVLAVDPSSSYTGGAVLGDRVRMGRHAMNADIFIRSFASRGSLGGISQGAKDVLYLYKSFGFDIIILESYGVGQAETDITNFVDVTAVVLAPGNGDYMQLAKAGTQEIADIFVVNKADNAEADALYSQLLSTFSFLPVERQPAVVKTVARDQKGIDELVVQIQTAGEKLLPNRSTKKRMRIANEIFTNALQVFDPTLRKEVDSVVDDVLAGNLTPFEAANQLGSRIAFLK